MNATRLKFHILDFIHLVNNMRIKILNDVKDKNNKSAREKYIMFRFRTIYPYDLNTLINTFNNKIVNVYDVL